MSAKGTAVLSPEELLYRARVKRLAVGMGIGIAAAFGIGWTFSFMTPMLAASFLAAPRPRPPLKVLVVMPFMILVALSLALLVSSIGLSLPVLAILSISLLIFRCFYALARGVQRMFTIWALIGTLLIPVISVKSLILGVEITWAIFWSGMAAMGLVWLAFSLVPDPPMPAPAAAPAKPAQQGGVDKVMAFKFAMVRTLILLPLVSFILLTDSSDKLKILIFSAILSMSPSLEARKKGGIGLVTSNLAAGLVATIFYELLVLVPSLIFLVLGFVLIALFCGRQIFGGGKWAALCSSGFGTVILLIGLGTMPIGDESGEQFYTRIVHLLVAALYIWMAFRTVAYLAYRKSERRPREAAPQAA
jgi:hypothetical protein